MRVVPCRGWLHAGSILRQQLWKIMKCIKIKRSERLSGLNSSMHLKFACANIQSKLLFPHGFSPYSVLYTHVCAPTRMVVLIFELTGTPASSEQRAKKISKVKWVTLIIPHGDNLSAIYPSHPEIKLKVKRNFANYSENNFTGRKTQKRIYCTPVIIMMTALSLGNSKSKVPIKQQSCHRNIK